MVNIGTRLKKLRTENKLTQTQVAEIFGLGVSSISSYESGDRKPSYAILRKYAAHFHVSTDYILGIDKKELLDISDLTEDQKVSVKMLISKYREGR
ncbi:MAG: helix-turn-helix domain-containing protein [Butyrivibrio sp.]